MYLNVFLAVLDIHKRFIKRTSKGKRMQMINQSRNPEIDDKHIRITGK